MNAPARTFCRSGFYKECHNHPHSSEWQPITINRNRLSMVFLAISDKFLDNFYSLLNVIAQLKGIILCIEIH